MASSLRISNIKYPSGCKEINEDLSTDDLIRRLKDIAMAFQQMSQEENNKVYIPLALYLANDFFLEHSSRDVRLLVACSIADVFRVFAPNAPYDRSEIIKRIFMFFIQQLKGLQDPKDATFKRYFYLLENLAWVKSFNICIELEDSQQIFCELFSLMFKIVNENHSDKVKNFMLDVLKPLIIESDTVSTKLLQIILMQIIDPKKTSNKQAYWLASQILQKTNNTLEPYITAFFSKVITRGINENGDVSIGENDDEDLKESNQKSRKNKIDSTPIEVSQICDLVYELYQICPNNVKDLLPHVEFKLKSSEVKERCEYTKLLARLFSDKNSELAKNHPESWRSFLGRFKDISVSVRVRCVQYSMHFLVNHPELIDDITEQLRQRQHDADENVRYEVVMAIVSAGRKGIKNINDDLLEFVKERTLDKKFKIRREALLGMSQLYKQYNYHLTASENEAPSEDAQRALQMLSWIKNKCMHNYYQTHLEDKLLVERILHTCLVPFSLSLAQRMRVLYMFYCSVDARAARAFNELLKQQQAVRRQMKDVMDVICRTQKPEEKEALLKQKVALVAKNLQEPVKAEEYLNKLCQNLETNAASKQHMTMIVTSASFIQLTEDNKCVPPSSSTVIENSVREILKSLGFPVQTNSFYMTIKQLMERIAPIMIDHQGLLMLFNYVSDSLIGDGELDAQMNLHNSAVRGLHLIHILSVVFPALFYGREIFNTYLLPFLWQCGDHPQIAELVMQILDNIGATAFSDSETLENSIIPWWAENEDFISRLIDKYILKASTTKQSKYAIQCLNSIILDENEKIKVFGNIIDQIKAAGLSLESTPYFRFHMVALGMIAINNGHIYFPKMLRSIVQKFIVQGLLLKDARTEIEIQTLQSIENDKECNDFNSIYEHCSEEIKAKHEGIKLLVRWIYGLKLNSILVIPENQAESHSIYQKAASNSLQLLKTIIQTGGDLNENGLGGTSIEKSFLKLSAALAMIKIAANDSLTGIDANNEPIFQKYSTTLDIMSAQQWHCLSTVLNDPQEFVREKFLTKLNKSLVSMTLGLEFLAFLSFAGLMENNLFKNKIRTFLHLNLVKRRDIVKSRMTPNLKSVVPEFVMPFVIHLLANGPFFTNYEDVQQLELVKECLWFIMEPLVLKNELYSFSFFKKIFENIKLCVDRVSASQVKNSNNDPNMIKAAAAINNRIYAACDLAMGLVMSKTQNFLLKEFPVAPSLPGKYYAASSDPDNLNKSYLPVEMQFTPPKRCGLETEMLNRINKNSAQSSSTRKKRGLQAQNQQQTQNSNDLIDESSLIENENSNNSLIHQQSNNRLLGDQSELKDESVANRYDLVDNEEVQQNQPNPTETVTEIVEDQTMRITDNQSGEISMQSNSGKRLEPCDNNDDSSPPRKSSRIAKKSSPAHPSSESEQEFDIKNRVTRATRSSGRIANKK
ncbi:Sister chromatid cohesion protein PDS5 -like protein B [Sarcoptes scabiei]|uniref:Sister chromatid cohesion protein PDS5 -like protein B n=1 Tax=Sarcoptes scabiei TaxID=52283 RepID=A0A834RDY6_SARSC|nr:Sister chromatid cohesion protein PDS5 -like protein B [Sarcoptes scabiei]